MDPEFPAITKLIDSSPIWEDLKTKLELRIKRICDTKGTDKGRMRQQGKGEPDMAFLAKRIVVCSSAITTIYGVNEKFTRPKIFKAYQKCVENKEAEFKFLLEFMRFDPKEIENGMDRLLTRRKKIGRQTVHGKNLLTIVLVELFYEVGYRKEKCFSIVSEVLCLIGSQEIPMSIVKYVHDFLRDLPSTMKTVKRNYYKYRDWYEIEGLLEPGTPKMIPKNDS